jgi:hypothetical protein
MYLLVFFDNETLFFLNRIDLLKIWLKELRYH